jgi:hypothetical protein
MTTTVSPPIHDLLCGSVAVSPGPGGSPAGGPPGLRSAAQRSNVAYDAGLRARGAAGARGPAGRQSAS